MTATERGRPVSAEEAEVLANIAEEYYVRGANQDAIASRLRISRSYVSRLLRRARELGIVEISVHRDIHRDAALEAALRERFALGRCLVVADEGNAPHVVLRRAGQLTANLLGDVVSPTSTIGLSWGHGVRAFVEALRPGRVLANHVVQMFGGLSAAPTGIHSGELVADAARELGATHERLHAPWIVESAELASALVEQPDISAVLRRAAAADVAVVGIGATGRGSSALLFNETYLSRSELEELAEAGAVGDICGRVFDAAGRPCPVRVMKRIIGLELDAIQRMPFVIGIALGAEKSSAVTAALRGQLIDALVTNSELAAEVITHEPS